MEKELFHQILEIAPIGYAYCEVILDENQKFVDIRYLSVNNTFKVNMGVENTDIIGEKRSEIFIQDDADFEWINNFSKVLIKHSNHSFKLFSNLANKHLKIDLFCPSKNRLVIFLSDITKEVLDSIEKSILLKTTSDFIFELNEEYEFINIYTNYEENLFINKEDLIHRNVKNVFNKATSSALIAAFKVSKQTEKGTSIIYSLIENNRQRWFLSSIFYVKFDQSYRYVVSTHDITKQKNIENQLILSNERLSEIAQQNKTVIWEVDKNGMYTYINDLSKDVFGYEPIEMIGRYFYEHYPEEMRLEFKTRVLEQMNRHEIVRNFESPYLTKNGERLWLLSFGSPIFDNEGLFIGYRGSDTDITEKHYFQLALKQSEEKYRFITENTSDVIWILNLNTYKFTYISPAVTRLRGYTVEEAMSQSVEESMSSQSWEMVQSQIEASLGRFILDSENASNNIITIQQSHKNGTKLWVEISTRYRFNNQNEIEIFGISRDVTERKLIDDEIRYLGFHDQLTGLYNRRYYELELDRLNTKRNHPISIIIADINGLKMTNDVFGHEIGDELIKITSNVLKDVCREDEIIVRTGGDEFLILLPKTNIEECEKIVNRIYRTVNKVQDKKYLISLSIGYSSKDTIDKDISDVTNQADRFMYQHKLVESEIYKRQLLGDIMKRLYRLDPDLRRHLKSTTFLVNQFGKYLNLSLDEIKRLKLAAMYHTIGRIGIDEKDIKLFHTNRIKNEYLLKRQPELSYQILKYISDYNEIAHIILACQENFDGTGYPKGLKGNEIAKESMIIHCINNFDKLRYNLNLSVDNALERLMAQSNFELEPKLCHQFIEMIKSNQIFKL